MKALGQVEKEVDGITDKLGKPVDRKIKHLVAALKISGFPTTSSCQGHLTTGFPYPWVEINYDEDRFDKAEIDGNKSLRRRIRQLLNQFYENNKSEHIILLQRIGSYGAFRLQHVAWDEAKSTKINRDSKTLLKEYQDEMNKFADFLLSRKIIKA